MNTKVVTGWLVHHKRNVQAENSLRRLISVECNDSINPYNILAMLHHTYTVKRQLNGGGISYLDCFKGTNLRWTKIACMAWITQSLCGSALTGYAIYFYE
jgi:SP family general alpha glucoside:H+ symporter-like MFS transporter